VGLTINQSNESAMHKTLTALSGVVTCVTGRALSDICWSVLAHLLLAGFLFSQSASAAPVRGVQEIAVDNAVISSPQTTLASLVRLTDTFHELVKDDGITRENEGQLRNIHQQVNSYIALQTIVKATNQAVGSSTSDRRERRTSEHSDGGPQGEGAARVISPGAPFFNDLQLY